MMLVYLKNIHFGPNFRGCYGEIDSDSGDVVFDDHEFFERKGTMVAIVIPFFKTLFNPENC